MIKLSILICSLESRVLVLNRLLSTLNDQLTNEVEVLVGTDAGQLTTGAKRNELLDRAVGEYIAFVDDDDLVSNDYVEKILKAVESGPDCCGMEGLITFHRTGVTQLFIHSLQYRTWFTKNNIYYRCPNHLSPVKRELALRTKFLDIAVGEDVDYSKRLLPFLKTEVYISGAIYYYLTQ